MRMASSEPLWEVALPGYTWYPVKKKGNRYQHLREGDWVLRWESPAGGRSKSRTINLLELDRELFLEFSRVETTLDGIKAFADRYGLLGIKVPRKRQHDSGQDDDAISQRASGKTGDDGPSGNRPDEAKRISL